MTGHCAFFKWKLLPALPGLSPPFTFSMAKVSDSNSLALLVHYYSNIAHILKCKGFDMGSKKCYISKACNQLFVLFSCETREGERTDISKPEKTD